METIKRINTSIPYDLWKEAQFKDISWSKAIITGINLLANTTDDLEELKTQLKEKEMDVRFIKDKISKMEQKKEEDKREEQGRIIMEG